MSERPPAEPAPPAPHGLARRPTHGEASHGAQPHPAANAQPQLRGELEQRRGGGADLRVLRLKTTTIRTDEGSLTGESETVMKHTDPVAANARIQVRREAA